MEDVARAHRLSSLSQTTDETVEQEGDSRKGTAGRLACACGFKKLAGSSRSRSRSRSRGRKVMGQAGWVKAEFTLYTLLAPQPEERADLQHNYKMNSLGCRCIGGYSAGCEK